MALFASSDSDPTKATSLLCHHIEAEIARIPVPKKFPLDGHYRRAYLRVKKVLADYPYSTKVYVKPFGSAGTVDLLNQWATVGLKTTIIPPPIPPKNTGVPKGSIVYGSAWKLSNYFLSTDAIVSTCVDAGKEMKLSAATYLARWGARRLKHGLTLNDGLARNEEDWPSSPYYPGREPLHRLEHQDGCANRLTQDEFNEQYNESVEPDDEEWYDQSEYECECWVSRRRPLTLLKQAEASLQKSVE